MLRSIKDHLTPPLTQDQKYNLGTFAIPFWGIDAVLLLLIFVLP